MLVCSAQEFRSTISGRITDATGAVVANAKVTATETSTGATSVANTSESGEYTLPFLAPGPYMITVEAAGFKKYQQDAIQVGTNVRLEINAKLEIGSQAESITVTADASLLQTTTASVGQVIATRQIESLPMNGRTPLSLAQLAYGVTPSSDPRFTRPFDNAGPSGFSMGGGQAQSNELLLDGSPDTTRNRRVAYNPPVDAVAEVKVEAFQPDAAYGSTAGGTVNVVMKSGTNDLHGSLYNFHQNHVLTSTPFFTNAANQVKPVTRYNQYGGTVGGPIWIPKVLNGRNKLFFFFGYEGIRQGTPEPTFTTVPTQAQRQGDFSQLLTQGSVYQLYDPATGRSEGSRIRRDPFPNNIIPTNRLNSVGRNIVGLIPSPNAAGRANGELNYFNNTVRSDVFFSYMGRMDWNVSDKHKLFFSMRTNDRVEDRGNWSQSLATGNFLSRVNWGATFDDVYTLSPTLIMNARLNWTRFIEGNIRPSDGFDFTTLGFPQSLLASSAKRVLPTIDLSNFSDIGNSGGDRTPFDSYQIFLSFTKVLNKHSVKFGADLRRQIESSNGFGNSSGSYQFNQNWTRGPFDNSPAAPLGQDLAALLLGLPTGGSWDVNGTRTQQAQYYAFFVQDDWRVTPSLTLNMGLRWEKDQGLFERWNRAIRDFDPTANLSITAAARAAYAASPSPLLPATQFNPVGGILYADGDNRRLYNTPNNLFAPRFGFAWQPNILGSKFVIRGGVGVYYQSYGVQLGIRQPGFNQSTPLVATLDNFRTPAATLSNPFPEGIRQPGGAVNGVNTFLGQSVGYTFQDLKNPYTTRWNFNIQRELGNNLVVELGYIGSRGGRLPVNRNINFIPESFLSRSLVRDQANIDRLTAVVSNPFRNLVPGTGLNGSTVSVEQLLRPYPQFSGEGGVVLDGEPIGYSDFHMFQARVEKRFSQGFSLLANFQYSKFLEATNRLYTQAEELEYRIAEEDRPYRFVLSGQWDLPFGRGKQIAGGAGPWLDRLVGGWQINGIYNFQSGPPVEWGNLIYFGGDLNWNARQLNGPAFDRTRFETNAQRQLERNVRYFPTRFSSYRADGVNNIDLSVIKNVRIRENIRFQLRGEAFNVWNRTQFNGPNLGATNLQFGLINSAANLPRTFQVAARLAF